MAEVKNAFIKSKMNRDLDARLIPSGEYREAFNAQISRSEGDDVGALENILGNSIVPSGVFEDGQSYADNLTAIGYTVDERSNCIYVFLTDGTRSSNSDAYVKSGDGSNHFIYQYDVATTTATKLVEGPFLNFSKNFPIYGVNLIENLLFFTDNFNQPRKINIDKAISSSGYYYNEDQISVSKYSPWQPIDLYQEITADRVAANPLLTAAQGEYDSSMRDVVSKFLPNGGTATVSVAATSSTAIDISNINIPFYQRTQTTSDNVPQVGMTVGVIGFSGGKLRGPIVDTGAKVSSTGYAAGVVNLDNPITVDVDDQLVFNFNHYYNDSYAGDSRFLEDKFGAGRFSSFADKLAGGSPQGAAGLAFGRDLGLEGDRLNQFASVIANDRDLYNQMALTNFMKQREIDELSYDTQRGLPTGGGNRTPAPADPITAAYNPADNPYGSFGIGNFV